MYTANKRQRKHRTLFKYVLFVTPFILIAAGVVWFAFFRTDDSTSTNFSKGGSQVAVVKPAVQEFTTDLFKLSLPSGWAELGKKNPTSDEVYYEYQSKIKDYDNRLLRVYVDVMPKQYPLNRLLPITVVDNRISPGVLSDDCKSFTGAPLTGTGVAQQTATWTAKWQGVDFICDLARPQNYAGTASQDEGNAVTLVSKNGAKHKYFFVYIDHNVRPDYQIFTDALKSFETI